MTEQEQKVKELKKEKFSKRADIIEDILLLLIFVLPLGYYVTKFVPQQQEQAIATEKKHTEAVENRLSLVNEKLASEKAVEKELTEKMSALEKSKIELEEKLATQKQSADEALEKMKAESAELKKELESKVEALTKENNELKEKLEEVTKAKEEAVKKASVEVKKEEPKENNSTK